MTRYLQASKCRATGLPVTVGYAEDLGIEVEEPEEGYPEPANWYTVCEEHRTLCAHTTQTIARKHAVWPEWCEDCQPILEAWKPPKPRLTKAQKSVLAKLAETPHSRDQIIQGGMHRDAYRCAKLGLLSKDPETKLFSTSERGKEYL